MRKFKLKTTASSNASAKPPSAFKHNIDAIIKALKIPPLALPHSPGTLTLKSSTSTEVYVGDLNQVWRYGATLTTPNNAVPWLEKVVAYALKELK